MKTTTLGIDGPEVGVIGLGCMGMSYAYDTAAPSDDEQSIGVIRRALDLGMTLIDTADVYGPFVNEELVGRALAGNWRDRAIVATKVGFVVEPGDSKFAVPPRFNGRPDHIRQSLDGSLRRLGTDRIDLYQLHRIDPDVPVEESWGAMAEAVSAGKVRHLGLSHVTVEEIERARSVHPVASVQSECSLWTREVLADVQPHCEQHGIALLPYSPLGRGFLAGRFASVADIPADDVRRGLPRFQAEALEANLAIVQRVRAIAERLGASPAQVALAWLVNKGRFVVPIPGTKTPKYLEDNAGGGAVELSADDIAELDDLPAPRGARV
ncbi:aldo/keto reductase [Nocardioides sp. Root1257]|uniref:aldo/keto reductase n=1 Tax=unclassified Nocardioides TaxID=2615069 RepID=UPI0006F9E439|nr:MULTISPECIES: aldo/keto reductase [unclassified Nocardioides]KQW42662.1 aldo/keto reductase [Nocardioides sp. Root1257]KRC39920.1 aldo/keto reductase [Nocardioides sp. Root224]